MKRKILTMVTIVSMLLMALAGCGGPTGNQTTSKAGLYQEDGKFIAWNKLGIDIIDGETPYCREILYGKSGKLVLPDNVTKIGRESFALTPLTSADLSKTKVTSIGDYAFNLSGLISIDLPDTLTSIGEYAFADTPLESINYAGTMEQWEAIDKGSGWSAGSGIKTITCSDGIITL